VAAVAAVTAGKSHSNRSVMATSKR
jgi:hypothetical protein